MAKGLLYEVNTKDFRSTVRPALYGKLGQLEPILAARMAREITLWLRQVIEETLRRTRLHDDEGHIYDQLMQGSRVYGAYSLNLLRGQIFADPWLRIHEYGGTIKPTGGRQYLALPIHYGVRSDGTPKYRNASSWKRWGSFVYKSPNTGKLYLAYKNSSGELCILYVLIDKVDIPARLNLTHTADELYPLLYATWCEIFVEVATEANIINLWEVPL